MKPIQFVLIGVALVAAVGAGFLMMNINNKPIPVAAKSNKPRITIPLVNVLIATKEIPMGTALGDNNIKWEKWPKNGVRESFIVQGDRPDAKKEYAKTINDQTKNLMTLRGLMEFQNIDPIPIEEVEPWTEIVKRFKTGAMSYGSISKEAHENLSAREGSHAGFLVRCQHPGCIQCPVCCIVRQAIAQPAHPTSQFVPQLLRWCLIPETPGL